MSDATQQQASATASNLIVLFAVMLGTGVTAGTILFREAERRRFLR